MTCRESGLGAVLNFSEVKKNAGWLGGGAFVNEASGFVYSLKDTAQVKTPLVTFSGLAGQRLVLTRNNVDSVILDFEQLLPTAQELHFIPRNMAPPNDSLRVWQKVTQFILADDMKKADLAKVKVEENARKLRKQREVTGEGYAAKYFKFDAEQECWVHTESAVKLDHFETGATTQNSNTIGEEEEDTDQSVTTFQSKTDLSESEDARSYF